MTEVLVVRLVRTLPPRAAGSARLVEVEEDGRRLALWPGEGPPGRPGHPALPEVLGSGVVEGELVWAELLPAGVALDEVEPGSPGVGRALADVARALQRLHVSGRAHGGLEASCVLLREDGGTLLGAVGEGDAAEDRAALHELVRRWLPEAAEVGGELSDLAERLDAHDPGGSLAALPRPAGERRLELLLADPLLDEHTAESGALDEVAFEIGHDERGRGLLDTWAGRTAPGEEATGAIDVHRDASLELTALLARLAAGVGRQADPDRFASREGVPSRALKARIADEPLDPLPVPEGLPLSGTGFLEPAGSADVTAVARRPAAPGDEPERTTTSGEVPEGATTAGEGAEISAALLVGAVVVALIAGALGAWLVLGGGLS